MSLPFLEIRTTNRLISHLLYLFIMLHLMLSIFTIATLAIVLVDVDIYFWEILSRQHLVKVILEKHVYTISTRHRFNVDFRCHDDRS